MKRPIDLLDFQNAKDFVPEQPAHKFYKSGEQWMVRCLKTTGTFSTAIWYNETYPRNECPCCKENVKR